MAGSHIFISVSHCLGLLSEDRVLVSEAGLSTEELMAGTICKKLEHILYVTGTWEVLLPV